jgi:phospholipid transport system substrate-binding protein
MRRKSDMKVMTLDRRKALLGALLLMLAVPLVVRAQDAIDNSSPPKLVETAARMLLADLDKNRAAYRKDLEALKSMVRAKFLPHLDVQFSAQQVLGKHWRTATPAQRQRFIDAFTNSLLATYGSSLLEFTADDLKVRPFRGDATKERTEVVTEIKQSTGAPVIVTFGVRNKGQGWKVWDVVIDQSVSFVQSFRTDFEQEIDQKGLDAVLARLESGRATAKK